MIIRSSEPGPGQILNDAVGEELVERARQRGWIQVTTVSDSNTYPLVGQRIHRALRAGGIGNSDIILSGDDLIADESSVMSVLADVDIETDVLVAVGSGTITDITRFVSHRLQKGFVSIPTAPSVDGYTSTGAPLILKGSKRSISCHAPSLVLASPAILASAPHDMIAAGFGNVLGKVTAVADWELAHLLTDAPFDRRIAADTISTYGETVKIASALSRHDKEAITTLFSALATLGESMSRFESSAPASGSEHHISHFLEMRRLATRSPPVLHGIRVALGTMISAQWYRALRNMSKETVARQPAMVPEYETDVAEITELLGEPGSIVLAANTFVSTLNSHRVANIRARLIEHWDEIQRIARGVPEPEELGELMKTVGCPVDSSDAGIAPEDAARAARLSHYVRNRFTIKTLLFTLGLPSGIEVNLR